MNNSTLNKFTIGMGICIATQFSSALSINATYGTSITGKSNAAAIMADINSVVAFYNSAISTTETVNITFEDMNSGLGQSNTAFFTVTYASYLNALTSHSSGDAIDTAALAKLTSNPYSGTNIDLSSANGRAVGLNTPASSDGTVSINTALCFTSHNSPVSGLYDMYGVVAHEVDEVLGTSSGVGGSFQTTDLFRYDGSGNRSFTTSGANSAYFSVDGTTLLDEYNQKNYGGGDYGDWIHHTPAQVQDFSGTPGVTVNPGAGELGLLDAIGYNMQPVPEPTTYVFLGIGALALIRRRK